jgi:hypothetical protein
VTATVGGSSGSRREESDSLGRFRAQVAAGRPIRLRVLGGERGAAGVIETSWVSI